MKNMSNKESKGVCILQPTDRAVRLPEVVEITMRSKTMIYKDIKDGVFPKGFLLGKRSRAWMLSDVLQWLESKKEKGG